MLSKIIFGRKSPGSIGVLELDAVLHEQHELQNEVTQFPVEVGFDVTDHIVKHLVKVSLTGIISNSPLKFFGGVDELFVREDESNRVLIAFEKMVRIAGYPFSLTDGIESKAIQVDLETSLRVYNDMILTSLRIPRDRHSGDSLEFTADFVKIFKVRSKYVLINNVNESKAERISQQGTSEVDAGKQTTQEINEVESAAYRAAKSLKGWLNK